MFPDATPPSTPQAPLMDLAAMKALLGVTVTTYDVQITFACNVVSSLLRSYTGRQRSQGEYEDTFHPEQRIIREGGGAFLSLMEYPVQSITSVTVNGVDQGVPTRLFKSIGITVPDNIAPDDQLVVLYEAGYDPIPYDLQSVFVDLVRRQLAALGVDLSSVSSTVPPSAAVKAVSVGALKVDYATGGGNASSANFLSPLSDTVLHEYSDILQLYRHSRMLASTPA